ncbi:MAG: tyrosine-protein phosphatase [Gaiellaceae bacterium]
MTLHQRDLAWEGLLNVRDLGGHSTEDGGETQYGRIVRADSIRRLTDEGWQALIDYGIKTIIDLRTDQELQADPPVEMPLEVQHISMFDEDPLVFMKVESVAESAPDAAVATREVYLVFLESFKQNVAAAIRAVAQAPEGGVVVHCMGGKDRTGLITAFLLHIAGVDTEQIAADYALSEERLKPRHAEWFAQAETEAELERLRRIAQTPAAAIVGVFEELERRYGSVGDYLRSGGLGDEDLARVRARLRD